MGKSRQQRIEERRQRQQRREARRRRRETARMDLPSGGLAIGLAEADGLLAEGRTAEAKVVLDELVRRYPRRRHPLERLLQLHVDEKDHLQLELTSLKLLEIDPDRDDALLCLGTGAAANCRVASAMQAFERLLAEHPDSPAAEVARSSLPVLEAELGRMLEKTGLAESEARQVCLLHEELARLRDCGQLAEARKLGERLLARAPRYWAAANNLSQILALEGRLEEAIALARRVLEGDPQNHHAQGNLVRYLFLSGQRDEARQAAERLKSFDTGRADTAIKQVEALVLIGDDAGVLQVLDDVKHYKPFLQDGDLALLQHHGAVALARQGQVAAAREAWQAALKLAPNLSVARDNLEDLGREAGQRHGPWTFALTDFVSGQVLALFRQHVSAGSRRGRSGGQERVLKAALARFPYLTVMAPIWLEQGDPRSCTLAVLICRSVASPELLAALESFARGTRGSDEARLKSAQHLVQRGAMAPGVYRLWRGGQWQETVIYCQQICYEAREPLSPTASQHVGQAIRALRANDGEQAERLLREAMAIAGEVPSLLYNLAMAYYTQRRVNEGDALVERVLEQYPDYFFSKIQKIRRTIEAKDLEAARKLAQSLLALPRLHVTEFAALMQVQVMLAMADENMSAAQSWLDIWQEVTPDDGQMKEMRRQCTLPLVQNGLLPFPRD